MGLIVRKIRYLITKAMKVGILFVICISLSNSYSVWSDFCVCLLSLSTFKAWHVCVTQNSTISGPPLVLDVEQVFICECLQCVCVCVSV